ncbi:MAG: copper resistance protein NlpE, partial [Ferruginibacter sp.]
MKRYPVLSISILVLSVFSFISCSPNKSSPEAVTQKDSGIVAKTLNINWGYYKSITPCADCEGIETVINLKKDNSFEEWSKYLGKKDTVFYRSGNIAIADNTTIQLIEGADTTLFHISTSAITMLDKTGDKVTGALADKYIFKQISSNGITNKYWVLKELNRQPVTAPNKSQA